MPFRCVEDGMEWAESKKKFYKNGRLGRRVSRQMATVTVLSNDVPVDFAKTGPDKIEIDTGPIVYSTHCFGILGSFLRLCSHFVKFP